MVHVQVLRPWPVVLSTLSDYEVAMLDFLNEVLLNVLQSEYYYNESTDIFALTFRLLYSFYTDHSACISLLNHPRPSRKLAR